jgi:hypothetical protein
MMTLPHHTGSKSKETRRDLMMIEKRTDRKGPRAELVSTADHFEMWNKEESGRNQEISMYDVYDRSLIVIRTIRDRTVPNMEIKSFIVKLVFAYD